MSGRAGDLWVWSLERSWCQAATYSVIVLMCCGGAMLGRGVIEEGGRGDIATYAPQRFEIRNDRHCSNDVVSPPVFSPHTKHSPTDMAMTHAYAQGSPNARGEGHCRGVAPG